MGSYGFGPARAAAAAVEQYADEQGISWPRAIAPFDVELVGAGHARAARSARWPSGCTPSCRRQGLQTLYDDRDAGPGEKFADAELLGLPAAGDGRASRRSPPASSRSRSAGAASSGRVPLEGAARGDRASSGESFPDDPGQVAVTDQITKRRLFGIDRSGPPPAATQSGHR